MPMPLKVSTVDKIVAMFDAGSTFAQISAKLGITVKNIEQALLDRGRIIRTVSGWTKPSVVAQRKRAAWLRAQGWTYERISVATGIPRETIRENWRTWAAKYNIELPPPADLPTPGMNGPVITYRIEGEQLIKEKRRISPISGVETVYETTTYDRTDPVVAEYRRMIEEGAYEDE